MPLKGIRILDFTSNLPGPYCTALLSDLGAQVIKVENPAGGDFSRTALPQPGGQSLQFPVVNRNKRSLALNLKRPQAVQVVMDLVRAGYDLWLEGFRPGVMAQLGLDYATVSQQVPGLIYCSISGFGQSGPRASAAGHDGGYLASSGLLYATGQPGGQPALPALPVADLAGGALPAAVGLLAAVIERGRTGRGRYIDVSMAGSMFSLGEFSLASVLNGQDSSLPGCMTLTGRYPCYRVYRSADGRHLVLCALEEKFWRNFLEGVGRPDLLPRQFDDSATDELAAIFAREGFAYWCDFARRVDCCLEPVLSPQEAWRAEQERDQGRVVRRESGRGRHYQAAPLLPGLCSRPPRPAPELGQHTAQILAELGYGPEQVRGLVEQGAVLINEQMDKS